MTDANDESPPAEAASTPAPEPAWLKYAVYIALALGVLFFCAPLGKSGIWDPFELNVADLSRRIAINVLGAKTLALDGADNSMPRLGDLGRGELPFDSIALGFRLFGLHEWSGRLPLALWGIAGVVCLYWLLARLLDRRAGLYGAIVLSTMPLYFMQSRTMLGDIVTMAALSMAFAGLGITVFDRRGPSRERILACALGVVGLTIGFMTRGLLVGVAIPALGVGLTWGVLAGSSERPREIFGDIVGALSLLLGAAALVGGANALFRATAAEYSMWVGAQISNQPKFPTFDLVIHYLGHSLFPWSAFIPFAVGRLFRSEPVPGLDAAAETRSSAARLLVLVGSAVAFGVYSLVAPKVGYLAFGAPALLAAIAAITIRDFEHSAPASRALGAGVVVLAALYYRDYVMFPEKGMSAFAVNAPTFPDSFKGDAANLVWWGALLFAIVVFFSWLEKQNRPWFERDDYLAWPRALRNAFGGNLLFMLVVLEVALILAGASVYLGLRVFHAKRVLELGVIVRFVLINGFWILPIVAFGPVALITAVRDLFRLFFDRTGVSRAATTAAAGLVAGSLMSFIYYPALAAQLSPKEVFESYQRLHKGGEPLGLLGVGGKSATYYSGGEVKMLTDVQNAFTWLTSSNDRRWLAVRNEDLGRLNSLFRGRSPKQNVPVLDARSSQIMLVSNVLEPSETNQSPYKSFVLDQEPPIGNRVEANMEDKLLSLGWDVTDLAGTRVESVLPGRKYRFRLYYKVLAPVGGEWETFIHIDGFHRRFNGDHKTLGGKYSFSYWQVGDYIVDDFEFSLEPNFTSGSYDVLYGLFVGETRLKIKTGAHDENRIKGGVLRVQ